MWAKIWVGVGGGALELAGWLIKLSQARWVWVVKSKALCQMVWFRFQLHYLLNDPQQVA